MDGGGSKCSTSAYNAGLIKGHSWLLPVGSSLMRGALSRYSHVLKYDRQLASKPGYLISPESRKAKCLTVPSVGLPGAVNG